MKIFSTVADRKQLVNTFGERLGIKPEYKGAPTFKYQIGPYTILKDGSIEVEDAEADLTLLRTLHTEGLVDDSWDEDRTVIEVTLPLAGHTGQTLTNLTFMMASKATLINKSIRCMGAFQINERFIEALVEKAPATTEEFMQLAEGVNANDINSGLEFTPEGISFIGFPTSENPDVVKAYMDLASLMNKQAISQKRVKFEAPVTDNEKYAFRVWLIRLGMNGADYKATRKILLDNLSGNCAFRTEDQAEAFREKHRKQEVVE